MWGNDSTLCGELICLKTGSFSFENLLGGTDSGTAGDCFVFDDGCPNLKNILFYSWFKYIISRLNLFLSKSPAL